MDPSLRSILVNQAKQREKERLESLKEGMEETDASFESFMSELRRKNELEAKRVGQQKSDAYTDERDSNGFSSQRSHVPRVYHLAKLKQDESRSSVSDLIGSKHINEKQYSYKGNM